MEENNNFIQHPSETAFHITCTNFSEKRREGVEPVLKQIRFSIRDGNIGSKILEQKFYPYTYYNTNESTDIVNVIQGIPFTGTLQWILNYKDPITGLRFTGTSVTIIEFFKLYFQNDHTNILSVSLFREHEDKDLDVTNFTAITEKCQMIQPGKVFIRKWKYISFIPEKDYKGKYSMVYFTPEGKLCINNAEYLSNCMPNSDFAQHQDYFETDENYDIHLVSIEPLINISGGELDIHLNYDYKHKSKKIILGAYTIPPLNMSESDYSAEKLGLNGISFKAYIPKSMNSTISVSGKVILTNYTVINIEEQTVFDDDMEEQNITFTNFANVIFGARKIIPSITADCSAISLGITPMQEILAKKIEINSEKMSNQLLIHFNEDEMFKFLHITIPEKYKDSYLGFFTPAGNVLSFLCKIGNKTIFNENFFYIKITSNKSIDIPLRRSESIDKIYGIQIEYFKFGSSKLVVLDNNQGYDIEFDDDIQRAFIMPTTKGITSVNWKGLMNEEKTDHYINIDNKNCLYFRNFSSGVKGNCTFFLSYAYISESQPFITLNLTYLKPLLDENGNYSFTIYCNNEKEIMAQTQNGDTAISPINNGKAKLVLTFVGEITFSVICKDKTGTMCLIAYDTPKQDGYHLIRYPKPDGISTTGAGFYAEIIPVQSNQSFMYYKTFYGALMTDREYPNNPIKVKMTINDEYYRYEKYDPIRTLCLVEAENQNKKIPFSRKYFSENFDKIIDLFGIKRDNFNFTQLETDFDGCLLIHYDSIEDENIKQPPNEVCDLPVIDKVEIDNSGQKNNFVDKSIKLLKTGEIAGIVVGCLLGVTAIVIVIIYFVKRKA